VADGVSTRLSTDSIVPGITVMPAVPMVITWHRPGLLMSISPAINRNKIFDDIRFVL
jgi:hypothetical protein